MNPQNSRKGIDVTWKTADVIWNWAGDTSDDYNRYTKRGLLSGVIGTTMAYWMRDESDNHEKTKAFLNDRIENVIFVGQNLSKVLNPIESAIKNFIMPSIKSKMNKG
jgi:ubiquinone biosynthesis protein COQ9